MKAALRSIVSYDVDNLASWDPPDEHWSIGVRLIVGPDDAPGDESFDITVCSPGWLATQVRREGVFDGHHHLILERFDWPKLQSYLQRRVQQCEGASWREVTEKLGRLGYWEFQDYRS